MSLLWATRGRTWGFRFVRTAGVSDPLPVYEAAFSTIEDEPEVWLRRGDTVAMRLPDPEGRKDQSGRVIVHDFVVAGETSEGVNSTGDGRKLIWPLVSDEYKGIYGAAAPPIPHA